MKTLLFLFLILAVHTCSNGFGSQSSELAGSWKIEITFENQKSKVLHFEATQEGKGSLVLEGSKSNWAPPTKTFRAKWDMGSEKQVSITAPMEFPIGNVGREPGILVFKGTYGVDGSITGEVKFFRTESDVLDANATPSRTGKFKATRANSN